MLFLFNSCREDIILKASLVPSSDTIKVGQTDSITILTKTFFSDSLITSQSYSGIPIYQALGSVTNDEYFGKTHAEIYFQVVPPTLDYKFPSAPDSAFIVLPYSGFSWGDTIHSTQTFKVFKVADTLSKDSSYYSFTSKAVDRSNLIGSVCVRHNDFKDSSNVFASYWNRVLKIPLKKSFIDEIYNESQKPDSSALSTFPKFLNFLKGIYIEPDTNNGTVLHYFRLDGGTDYTRANILFYYTQKDTNTNTSTVKNTSFYFTSTYAAHYNRIIRSYAGSKLGSLLSSTNKSDSIMVLQNEPGLVADLKFPFIKNLPKTPINKAELIITEYSFMGDNKDIFFHPSRVYPVGVNDTGKTYNILDRYPLTYSSPLVFMDGNIRTMQLGSTTVNQYILNIPREVQSAIVLQKDTLHLRISGAANYPGAYRLITAGGKSFSNSLMSVKLNIVYSKQ